MRNANAPADDRAVRLVAWSYAALSLGLGLLIVSAPLEVLLDRFVPDDVFYYFNTARHFAASGFSSFDRIHFTNGYQPLWFLISTPIFFVFPNGGEVPVRVLLFVQVACAAAAAGLMTRTVARAFGATPAGVAGLLWLIVFHRVSVNGLETALQCLLFAVVFALAVRLIGARDDRTLTSQAQQLGLAAALLFLARTDAAFLLLALAGWLALRHGPAHAAVRAYVVPAAVIAGAYLLLNLWTTGHLMPVSGAAKMYHSEVARAATAAAQHTSPTALAVANLRWPLADGAWWLVASLASPLLLLAAARLGAAGSVPAVRALWPFALYIWAAFAFYAIAFYGGFSRTLWYYGPAILLGWFSIAGLSAALARISLWRPVPWSGAFVMTMPALGWWSALQLAAAAIGAPLTAKFAPVSGAQRTASLAAIAVTVAFMWWTFANAGIWLSTFIMISAVAALLGGLVPPLAAPRLALAHIVIGVLLPAVLVHGKNLAGDLTAPASHWNAHLYRGAIWARQHLPADAVIWSGSAGILGYFSERRTVNTDGLANSYAFLENVLRAGQLRPFVSQFDYAIDAYGDDSLARQFPEGCFIPLPAGTAPPPFADGAHQRQLAVFQMKPTGIVDCAAVRQR